MEKYTARVREVMTIAKDQRTKGPKDQRTKGPKDRIHILLSRPNIVVHVQERYFPFESRISFNKIDDLGEGWHHKCVRTREQVSM